MKSSLTVEPWTLDQIKPYDKNPRNIPVSAIIKVASSIKVFGWRQPIVVDEDGIILAGHTRYLAAQRIHEEQDSIFNWPNIQTAPVHQVHDLNDFEKRAYRIADNKTAEETNWNNDILSLELQDLEHADFDLESIGFEDEELAELLNSFDEDDDLLPLSSNTKSATTRTLFLKWGTTKVALLDSEKEALDRLADQWATENGLMHGFVQGCLLKGKENV